MGATYFYWFTDEAGDSWLLCNIPGRGKGDLAFRMANVALFTGDPKIIKACIKLLNDHKRWPDELNEDADAKTWFGRIVNRTLNKLFGLHLPFRAQKRMTRDAFTMLIAAIFWHQYEMIQDLKIPWYINSAPIKNWKKYLETNDPKYENRYEKAAIRNINVSLAFGYHAYVKYLNAWMAFIARSDEVKARILPFIPEWNICVRMLCGEELDECCQDIQPREGFIWQYGGNIEDENDFLGPDEPIYLDTGILQFVYRNQNWK